MISNPDFHNPDRVHPSKYIIVRLHETVKKGISKTNYSFRFSYIGPPVSTDLETRYEAAQNTVITQTSSNISQLQTYKTATGIWGMLIKNEDNYECIVSEKKIDRILKDYAFERSVIFGFHLIDKDHLEIERIVEIVTPKASEDAEFKTTLSIIIEVINIGDESGILF